jgi:A/G-specific adenine glycosylase
LKRAAATLVTDERPGDWAQALMDLGATICRPKAPLCDRCPVAAFCAARASGRPEDYPRKAAKADRPRRYGTAFLLTCRGKVALVRRPDKGLLGGMLALPTDAWSAARTSARPPADADWRPAGEITHVFTHFSLSLRVMKGETARELDAFTWTDIPAAQQALPTVFRKALKEGLSALL